MDEWVQAYIDSTIEILYNLIVLDLATDENITEYLYLTTLKFFNTSDSKL